MKERALSPAPGDAAVFRTERSVAALRVAVVTVAAIVYVASLGIRRSAGGLALSILALAAIYSLWTLLARPYESYGQTRYDAATLLLDAGLITLWCHATGGPRSEFWTLNLIVVISVAMRFDLVETLGAALGLAALYVTVMTVDGGLSQQSLLLRPAVVLMTGFAVGVLARQKRASQQRQAILERLAEERSRALAEEQRLVERLRRVDVAKTEFVAVASHEFRTPLAAILGVMKTLQRHGDDLDPALKAELMEGAAIQAARLSRLVEDLLTVSSIENGALPLSVQPVDLDELVSEAVKLAATGPVTSVELNDIERVYCDPDQIVRIITNLLDNARKYSPPGALISLSVREEGSSVCFSVRDRGPGVPVEERERVFDRFQRLMTKPDTTGTGLGLYIARCLVDAHGGRISVKEAEGGGAEFTFTIPVRAGARAERAARPKVSSRM